MKIISIVLFLALAGGLAVVAAPAPEEGQKCVAVIYGSRYGSTAQTAEWIAEGMQGKAVVVAAKDAGDLAGYKKLVLGSGIYGDLLHADMATFLEKRGSEVKDRVIALFVVCGAPAEYAKGYLEMFAAKCGAAPLLAQAFPGWLKKELLSPEDFKGLEGYYQSIGQPFTNWDKTDKAKCLEFGREILAKMSGGE